MATRQYRRIHLLFRLALVSVMALGASRVILDNLRNDLLWPGSVEISTRHRYTVKMPIDVSEEEAIEDGCNVFEGKWVWDNASHPLYREESCPFLVKQTTCLRNGRPDSFYQNWRWQPNACNLPRFDGLKLMEILRDKRLMFVGDSVQRSMFESMVCLVQSAIPSDVRRSLQRIPPRKVFKVEEFNATIEYYWAPFIVESISDHATNHTVLKRLVRLDSVAKHSKEWQTADVLIFESYVWWMYNLRLMQRLYKRLIGHDIISISLCDIMMFNINHEVSHDAVQLASEYGSLDNIQEYNVTTAYRLALETWANWIGSSINPQTQKIFLHNNVSNSLVVSFVPQEPQLELERKTSWEWKPGTDGNCFNETQPIDGSYWGTGSNLDIMGIVEDVLGETKG
ncbi:UNVERIFIED_CONTAM: protein trichome birefringence-like 31 [Sesamum calycinum]|uniref:Protein trichome birefringence-like 31 n=1 Tax=Sesamum calycinum TaxID=2727403 RepID=A0AAW2Q4Y9_9LAMI